MTTRSYKFRFYPTKAMQAQLALEFGHARFVWNWGLDMRNKRYARLGANINSIGISRILTQLKKTSRYDWLNQASATCLGQSLRNLDTAFANFFNPKIETSYPKFKKRGNKHSVRYQDIVLDQNTLKIPKLGNIHACVRWSRRPLGTPKMATISLMPSGKYYVSFSVDELIRPKPKTKVSVGIDLGINDVFVTNHGLKSGNPKWTNKYSLALRRAQRGLSKKKKGSNRWQKQRIIVAKIHEKLTHSRQDFINKWTTMLVSQYDLISAETLKSKNMMKNRRLAKSIADVSWFEIVRQLEYKSGWYGKSFVKIDQWFPSTKTCSDCGHVQDMPLANRLFDCENCDNVTDRDVNAAINILEAGRAFIARGGKDQCSAIVSSKKILSVKREDKLNFPDEHSFAV